MNCTLEISGEKVVKSPTADDIERVVSGLETGKSGSFLILSRDQTTYLQASGDMRSGFAVEYQEGDVHHHFRTRDDVSAGVLVRALVSYATGSEEWRKLAEWEEMVT